VKPASLDEEKSRRCRAAGMMSIICRSMHIIFFTDLAEAKLMPVG